jgi:hypothetical protein
MDDNPYKSSATSGATTARLMKVWSYPAFCVAAIVIPSALGAVALIADMSSVSRQPVVVHSVGCLILGAWSIFVVAMNKLSRRL